LITDSMSALTKFRAACSSAGAAQAAAGARPAAMAQHSMAPAAMRRSAGEEEVLRDIFFII
jgi:hypothetical protein